MSRRSFIRFTFLKFYTNFLERGLLKPEETNQDGDTLIHLVLRNYSTNTFFKFGLLQYLMQTE